MNAPQMAFAGTEIVEFSNDFSEADSALVASSSLGRVDICDAFFVENEVYGH
jgi:hypothetical protein